jgi:hypothetical protein
MKYKKRDWKGNKGAHVTSTKKERRIVGFVGEWIEKEMNW